MFLILPGIAIQSACNKDCYYKYWFKFNEANITSKIYNSKATKCMKDFEIQLQRIQIMFINYFLYNIKC